MIGLFFEDIALVLLVGVLVGAGLPALFAVGVRALAYGAGGDAELSHESGHAIGTVIAFLCFAVCLLVIAMGISIVVSSGLGYSVDFSHVIPVFHKK
ncbi:hypothetical protein GCM10009638_15540 [Luteococcus sanguinis]